MKAKDALSSLGLLVLRVGMGGYMLSHGIGKLNMALAGDFESFADPIGVGKTASLWLAVFAEFGCSILVMLGLGTRLAAIPLVITMAVAAFVVHSADPWSMETAVKKFFAGETQFPVAKQMALMFLIPFLSLVFTGPGCFSVDAVLGRVLGKRGAKS